MPAGPREVREAPRHSARYPMARARRRGAALGDRGRGGLVPQGLVRREALLRLARDARLQDARARAAVALPRLHALQRLRWRTPEDRRAPVARRQPRARQRGTWRRRALPPT